MKDEDDGRRRAILRGRAGVVVRVGLLFCCLSASVGLLRRNGLDVEIDRAVAEGLRRVGLRLKYDRIGFVCIV